MTNKFSQIYTSAKYVRKGDGEGNLTDEIYMIEAVKSSDGCSEFIWKKEGNEYLNAGQTFSCIHKVTIH